MHLLASVPPRGALPLARTSLTSLFSTNTAELYSRQAIRDATLISNPGCYATNTQALIAPLLEHLDLANPPTVFGVSGYSGAGTKAAPEGSTGTGGSKTVPKVSPASLAGGIRPYSLTDHIHEREASRHLSELLGEGQEEALKVAFVRPSRRGSRGSSRPSARR